MKNNNIIHNRHTIQISTNNQNKINNKTVL